MLSKGLIAAAVLNAASAVWGATIIAGGGGTWVTGLVLGLNIGLVFHLWLQRFYGRIIDSYRGMLATYREMLGWQHE